MGPISWFRRRGGFSTGGSTCVKFHRIFSSESPIMGRAARQDALTAPFNHTSHVVPERRPLCHDCSGFGASMPRDGMRSRPKCSLFNSIVRESQTALR